MQLEPEIGGERAFVFSEDRLERFGAAPPFAPEQTDAFTTCDELDDTNEVDGLKKPAKRTRQVPQCDVKACANATRLIKFKMLQLD